MSLFALAGADAGAERLGGKDKAKEIIEKSGA